MFIVETAMNLDGIKPNHLQCHMQHVKRKMVLEWLLKWEKIFLGTALVIESRYNHKGKQLR